MSTVPDNEQGGDPACWANRVCPDCGALTEGQAAACARCGAALVDPDE